MKYLLCVLFLASCAAQVPCTLALDTTGTGALATTIAIADCDRDLRFDGGTIYVTRRIDGKLTTDIWASYRYAAARVTYSEPVAWLASVRLNLNITNCYTSPCPANPFPVVYRVRDRRDIQWTAAGLTIRTLDTAHAPTIHYPWQVVDSVEITPVQ